ncbi:hypothetical protein MBLNU459_g0899t1 [Dothideomycetes sp. NU459]
MEVLKIAESFEDHPFGPPSISTVLVLRLGDDVYFGRLPYRCMDAIQVDKDEIEHMTSIPKKAFQPPFEEHHMTRASLQGTEFLKRPSLLSYDWNDGEDANLKTQIAQAIYNEVKIYESFINIPHDNIGEYLGCEVESSRVSAICLVRYKQSMMERFNPGSLNKRAFARANRLTPENYKHLIDGIRMELQHLHSLGLVHNDLNPANVMIDDNDSARPIDFGSCRRVGESLCGVGRTYEWYDDQVNTSIETNDWHALDEIEAWLNGKESDFSSGRSSDRRKLIVSKFVNRSFIAVCIQGQVLVVACLRDLSSAIVVMLRSQETYANP